MVSTDTTNMLRDAEAGDPSFVNRLFPLVYEHLREVAERLMRLSGRGHTLQPTALVHEAFLKMVDRDRVSWEGRAHFLAVGAIAMRQILMNHARDRRAAKRGGGWQRVTLVEDADESPLGQVDAVALHDGLEKLAMLNERQCKVVVARFLGGLSVQETAHVLDLSERTVKSDWRVARAWLARELRA